VVIEDKKDEYSDYDVIPHTVTAGTGPSDPNKGKEFDSGLSTPLMPGKTFSHRFTTAGGFPYFCQLHPAMAGTVTVTPIIFCRIMLFI